MNNLEVFKTYGSNKKLMKTTRLNYQFKDFKKGLISTYNWYNRYKHLI